MQNQHPTPTSYPIRGTHVTSPYPPQLTPGECRLIFTLEKFFAPENIFADCYFPKPDPTPRDQSHPTSTAQAGNYLTSSRLTQIDCLALGPSGIYVFESKDYSGWIYGHADRREWTEVLNFGREKHQFYNPVRQNTTHISALHNLIPDFPIFSIIVFGRDATLKVIENLPPDCHVCTQSQIRPLLSHLTAAPGIIAPEQLITLRSLIINSRIDPTTIIRDEHIHEAKSAQNRKKY